MSPPKASPNPPVAPLHVALVTRRFTWKKAGGGEVSVSLLARHLAERGHRVSVLAVDTEGAPEGPAKGLSVHRLGALTTREVAATLRRIRPDVAHSYNMETAPATVRAARLLGVPVVVTVNSAWATCLFADMYRPGHGICETCTVGGVRECFERRPPEQVGRRVPAVVGWGEVQRRLLHLRFADQLVVLSEASKDLLVRNGLAEDRIRVVPNFHPGADDLPPEPPEGERVLYVGALTYPKGTDVLLRAFARLAERRPGVTLELVGDGPYRPQLEALAKELGVTDRVEFAGYVPNAELPARYARAAAVAFPVRTEEAFGRVILEAWAAGTPVVASRLSAPGEILRDGETGLLVPPEDPSALGDALERVLTDPDLAARLAEAGRAALAEYAPVRVVPRLVAVYEEAAGGH